MEKKKIFSLLFVTTICFGIGAFILFTPAGADYSLHAHATECDTHNGYHYSYKAPTETESGHKEFWTCCKCHQSFIVEPEGSFVDADDSTMTGGLDINHIAYLAPTGDSIVVSEDDGDWGDIDWF